MNYTSDDVEKAHLQIESQGGLWPCEYTFWDCRHCFFQTVLYEINEIEIKLEPLDYQILSKPSLCPKCCCKSLHEKRFSWHDLPKEFTTTKLQYLLDSLSAEALYEVNHYYLNSGALTGKRRDFNGKFYLKAARLGSPRAMEKMIYLYEVGQHVPLSVLRSIAWAKRRYDYAGGEQAQLFDYLQTLYKGGDIGGFLMRWEDQNA